MSSTRASEVAVEVFCAVEGAFLLNRTIRSVEADHYRRPCVRRRRGHRLRPGGPSLSLTVAPTTR